MSPKTALPLAVAAALGGLIVLGIGPTRQPDLPVPPQAIHRPAVPEGAYFSHDWYEPPPRAPRRTLLDAAGQNPTLACTLPNCRNCQIHATWKQAL